ncbi:MAG: pallilysin-related adhesin [Treponema sp.]
MKKILYSIITLIILGVSVWLIYYRIAPHITVHDPKSAQTIVPHDMQPYPAPHEAPPVYPKNEKNKSFENISDDSLYAKKFKQTSPLHELQKGNSDSFQSFLAGLWYEPASKTNPQRSIFFNNREKLIIFSIDNIEEIFTITSSVVKQYGILFSAHNTSIPSIKRRIDISMVNVDEINIRVIDDVARLKIETTSSWDGLYRKTSNISYNEKHKLQQISKIKTLLSENGALWKTADGHTLSFSDSLYTFEYNDNTEKGKYTLFTIQDTVIMQWKNYEKKNTFFTLTLDTSTEKKRRLTLAEVLVTPNADIRTSTYQLVFEAS